MANQTLLGAAPEVLEGLRRAGLSALLLGGVPLVLAYYRDHGARRIDGLEVAVPREELARAGAVLVGLGWTPAGPRLDPDRSGPSVQAFGDASGRAVKLYGHILPGYPWPQLDARLRRRALPLALPGGTATVLAVSDLLLRVLVCDTGWRSAPSLVWMADAAVILRSSATTIDWEGVAEEARQLGAGWTAWRGLDRLATLRVVELPAGARRAFQDVRPTVEERIEQWCRGRFARALARACGVADARSLAGAVARRLARRMVRAKRPPADE